jgi:hypothetical protein
MIIPFRHDDETYFSKMGKNHESLHINRSKMVPVYIHGPSTPITEAKSPDIEMSQASNLKTCFNFSHHQTVPIVLCFHGVGLVVGSAANNRALAYVRVVLNAQGRKRKQRKVVSAQGSDNTSKS